jgi:hypothetical protein
VGVGVGVGVWLTCLVDDRATEYTVEVWVKPYFATHYNYDGIVTTLWNTGTLLVLASSLSVLVRWRLTCPPCACVLAVAGSYQSGYGFYYDPCGVNWWVASPSSAQLPNRTSVLVSRVDVATAGG